jgi:undecaprenyl-diphosphatase
MQLDISIFRALNGLAGQSVCSDAVFIFLSNYLIYIIVLAAAVLLVVWKRTWREKVKVIAIALITSAAAYLIAAFVFHSLWPRLRPFDGLANVNQLVGESGFSFPSRHAVFAFLLATFIFGFNKKAGWWLFVLAVLVCFGRVLVGVHYPLDVFVGAIFGALMGWAGMVATLPS